MRLFCHASKRIRTPLHVDDVSAVLSQTTNKIAQSRTKMAACTAPLGAASTRFLFKDQYLWKTKLLTISYNLKGVKRGE